MQIINLYPKNRKASEHTREASPFYLFEKKLNYNKCKLLIFT